MIRLPTLMTDTATAAGLLSLVAVFVADADHALGVAAGAVLTLVNVAAMGWLVQRVVTATAEGRSAGVAATLLGLKGVVVLMAWTALASVFPPIAVATGVASLVLGLFARSTWMFCSAPAAQPQES